MKAFMGAMLVALTIASVRAEDEEAAQFLTLEGYETKYRVVQEGEGDKVVSSNNKVTVHATGIVQVCCLSSPHSPPFCTDAHTHTHTHPTLPTTQNTGKKFWSTKDAGQRPFSYTADTKSVITGWDQGTLGMKIGEIRYAKEPLPLFSTGSSLSISQATANQHLRIHRQIIIPAKEGYGEGGFPSWGIPPGGILDFEIEVLKIQ